MKLKTTEDYARLSPFELKDKLMELARRCAGSTGRTPLDAGRGNPDWLALDAREAFFALGQFALGEARAGTLDRGLGSHPRAPGIAARLDEWTEKEPDRSRSLRQALAVARDHLGIEADAFVHEMALGVLGADYPLPVRMLGHVEHVVQAYLRCELGDGGPARTPMSLFATEGATAGISYIFQSLVANEVLHCGDRIAIGVPAFTPYLDIPRLDAFRFDEVRITASASDGWQYPDAEIDRLADTSIRAFFLINPGNPTSVAICGRTLGRIENLVREARPDLIVITDDVYATFAPGYQSLSAAVPANTITVYSFSKYFGCTGWRLGVVGIHEDNVIDRVLQRMPDAEGKRVASRYRGISVEPERLRFIDRMVADSRTVALNHTAGLSGPQQVQMALFALQSLADRGHGYKDRARKLLLERRAALYRTLGIDAPDEPLQAGYYATIDLLQLARHLHGDACAKALRRDTHPLDLVFSLARDHAMVVLPGEGFGAPAWSVRISLANLALDAYRKIGAAIRAEIRLRCLDGPL